MKLKWLILRIVDEIELITSFKIRSRTAIIKKRDIPRTILIALPNASGDIALNSSLTKTLRIKYPKAKLILITCPVHSDIAKLNKFLNKVLTFPENRKFTYKEIKNIVKDYKYDWLIIPTFDPDLINLLPKFDLIKMQYYLSNLNKSLIEAPRLVLSKSLRNLINTFLIKNDLRYKSFVFINTYSQTADVYGELPSKKFYVNLIKSLLKRDVKVVVNNFGLNMKIKHSNLILCEESFPVTFGIASASKTMISPRNGICDIVASLGNTPQVNIYPKLIACKGKSFFETCSLVKMFGKKNIREVFCNQSLFFDIMRDL